MAVTKKYAQIRRDGNVVCLVGDETLGMPIDSECVYTINIANHEQRDSITAGMVYNPDSDVFYTGNPTYSNDYGRYGPFPTQEVIATSAVKSGTDTIVLDLPAPIDTGTVVKFSSPCACTGISKLQIEDEAYSFKDALGNTIADISGTEGGVFTSGAIVSVILDKTAKVAYIQNPAKNIYETTGNLKKVVQNTDLSAAQIKSGLLPLARGGTGAATAEGGRTNLGFVCCPESDYEAMTTTQRAGKVFFCYEE